MRVHVLKKKLPVLILWLNYNIEYSQIYEDSLEILRSVAILFQKDINCLYADG